MKPVDVGICYYRFYKKQIFGLRFNLEESFFLDNKLKTMQELFLYMVTLTQVTLKKKTNNHFWDESQFNAD